jgi:predicted TIM-barrel fold metal-dependent hydrolase
LGSNSSLFKFSSRYLGWAIELLGSERIIFATDYLIKSKNGDRAVSWKMLILMNRPA